MLLLFLLLALAISLTSLPFTFSLHLTLTCSYDLSYPPHLPPHRRHSRRYRKASKSFLPSGSPPPPAAVVLDLIESNLSRLMSNAPLKQLLPSAACSLPSRLVSSLVLTFEADTEPPSNALFKINRMLPDYVRVTNVEVSGGGVPPEPGGVKGSLVFILPSAARDEGDAVEIFYRRYASRTEWVEGFEADTGDGERELGLSVTGLEFLDGREVVGVGAGEGSTRRSEVCRVNFELAKGWEGEGGAERIVRSIESRLGGMGERLGAEGWKRLRILEDTGLHLSF